MRRLLIIVVAVGLAACTTSRPAEREVTVFAAASLSDAFSAMGAAFEAANPGVRVRLNTAGSSQLAAQLLEGAPADVFASANEAQMANVAPLRASEPVIFATNELVGIVPADNPAGISDFADFAEPGVALVLAAPGVPAREYTDQLVARSGPDPYAPPGFAERFYANVVSEEDNVRQVVAKVALGEADAGVVYTSDVTGAVRRIAVPYNVEARYPITVLSGAPQPELAEAFVAFVLSDAGQALLEESGFGPIR